jgi:membrane protein YqaA with SNARE-associated domain
MPAAMFRSLYDWTLRMARHRHAMAALAAVSFAESSFFPIPPDVMVVPMILARREQAWLIAAVCTLFSVLGGIAGYAIGMYLYDSVARPLIELYGMQASVDQFRERVREWGVAIILIKGLTPIPFKLVTITSGLSNVPFLPFVAAAAATRGVRFFVIAALLRRYGEPMQAFIEKRLTLVSWVFLAVLVGGFAAVMLI